MGVFGIVGNGGSVSWGVVVQAGGVLGQWIYRLKRHVFYTKAEVGCRRIYNIVAVSML